MMERPAVLLAFAAAVFLQQAALSLGCENSSTSSAFFVDDVEFAASEVRSHLLQAYKESTCRQEDGCGMHEAMDYVTPLYHTLEKVRPPSTRLV